MRLYRIRSPRRTCAEEVSVPAGTKDESGANPIVAACHPQTQSAVALDPFVYRDSYWCADCAGPQTFVPLYETDFGRVGFCLGCGQERVQQFTRTIGDVA